MGEHNFVDGKVGPANVKTPDAAKFEIKDLIADESFQKEFASGNVEAVSKWKRLHRMAYPEG